MKIDLELFKKVCESQPMTKPELAKLFNCSKSKVYLYQKMLGIIPPETIECDFCGEARKLNCYSVEHAHVCVKCRVALGIEVNKRGRKKGFKRDGYNGSYVRTVRVKCAECRKPFLSRVTFEGKHAEYYCPVCKESWHEYEDPQESRVGLRGMI